MTTLQNYFNQLSPLSAVTWKKLNGLFKERTLAKGNFFIREGETAKEIGFLKEGIIRAFYRSKDGVEYNKHFFVAPCFIGGYASMITGAPNQINQEALSKCMVLAAPFPEFKKLYETCPDLERAARILAEKFFVQKEQREIEIVLLDADKRYQLFLEKFASLEQQIPQYHIASYLGVTPTQLSRIRKKIARR